MKKKKPHNSPYKPTLHICEAVPITEPEIIAAFEKMRHMAKPVVPKILREYAQKTSQHQKKEE